MGESHSGPERRATRRFPIELEVRYRTLTGPRSFGTGKTVNMSSGGLLIAADDSLAPRTPVEIVAAWPLKNMRQVPLNLTLMGRVVRVQQKPVPAIAIKIHRYEFVAGE